MIGHSTNQSLVLQDVIGRWEEFVEDHTVYHNNYAQCAEWVATLRKRLQICGDLAGDRQDVEDRQVKLQVCSFVCV